MSDLAVETKDLTRKFGAFEALKGVLFSSANH